MMGRMEVVLVALLVVAAAAIAWLVATRRPVVVAAPVAPVVPPAPVIAQVPPEVVEQAVAAAVAQANDRAARERDLAVQSAIQQAVMLTREQLGAHTQAADASLAGRQQLIDAKLGEVQSGVQADLGRLTQLVQQLGNATTERLAVVDHSLQAHAEITQSLAGTANSLREALASSNARGQWGERMAEDVLRMAGMQEKVNYFKRTSLTGDGAGIPDFTFVLPKGHVLFMDVKFPMASYLKYLEAGTEAERSAHRATFVRDVRARVRELAKREYAQADDRPAVENVLLFVPNESLAAFIHESDTSLVEEAMAQHIVICSPLTLFAFLGVIRQAFDNFVIEQTSKEILGLLGKFDQQWGKYTEQVDKVRRQFDMVNRSFEELATTRRRALERPLNSIDDLRRKQALPIDGELFGAIDELELDNVRELGA
jgi:DNA recombination protein RmuC